MKSSSKIIMALLNTLPDSDHLYLTLIDGIWPRVIGPDLASRSQPVAWEGGTLTVAVPSEDWKDHLYLLASDLIPRVNEELYERHTKLRSGAGRGARRAPFPGRAGARKRAHAVRPYIKSNPYLGVPFI